jgi:hypothetical protein
MSRVFVVVWPRQGKATALFAALPFVSLVLVMSAVDPWADFEVGTSPSLLVSRSSLTVIV